MVVVKPFLDEIEVQQMGNFALALFHDISLAVSEGVLGVSHKVPRQSRTAQFANSLLANLCENDWGFNFGYLAGARCLEDVRSASLQQANGPYYASKSLETLSRENQETLFLHLWHMVEIDIATVKSLTQPIELFSAWELTAGGGLPGEPRYYPSDLVLALRHAGTNWSYWRDWYQGFLDGKPLDWELQHRVAQIDDATWDAGPESVAAEIERIRTKFSALPVGNGRFPKHEPKSVSHLIEHRAVASASLQGLAVQVTHSIDRYYAETRANALPEALEPLTALPALLLAVNSTIQEAPNNGTVASETEDQLRAEVGRLNAQVAQLESELQKASVSNPSVFSDAFKKQLGTSLGGWQLYAALCTGLWFVSGDTEGMQRRLENISNYRNIIFGDVSSPSIEAPANAMALAGNPIEI
ncbi:hypothetical protein [Leisingera sp. S232]|uniref:hypothetical protein n=1 Tax=Leisingera sp. S232 TaxID=3415132 RepID=UPI003C7E448C